MYISRSQDVGARQKRDKSNFSLQGRLSENVCRKAFYGQCSVQPFVPATWQVEQYRNSRFIEEHDQSSYNAQCKSGG